MMTFLARRRVPLGFLAAVCATLLARPTKASWLAGLAIAILGEAIRLWASGHLEKSREVTRTGPYRWTAHPLYVGSSVMALGVVVAAHSAIVGVLVAIYMTATITAAVRTEEAFLRRSFGPAYDQYRRSEGTVPARRFSVSRVLRNREYRAVAGLSIGFALLALKVVLEI